MSVWFQKISILVFVLLVIISFQFFLSCSSRKAVLKSKGQKSQLKFVTTYESADSLDKNISLRWESLFGLTNQEIDLQKKEPTIIQIQQPTLFYNLDHYFVYPGEIIEINVDSVRNLSFSVKNNRSRTYELEFFRKIKAETRQRGFWPDISRIPIDDTGLLSSTFLAYQKGIRSIFDSLIQNQSISNKFKSIAEKKINAMPYDLLLAYYRSNRDLLLSKNLYSKRFQESILPALNSVTDIEDLMYGFGSATIEQVSNAILPYSLHQISSTNAVEISFDSASHYFTGITRDFVLSKIIYNSLLKRLFIPKAVMSNYNKLCKTEEFKKIISTYQSEFIAYKKKKNKIKSDLLLGYDKHVTDLSKLIDLYKGKLIVLDFWSSWCAPCIREIPSMKALYNNYSQTDIVFLSISLDKEFQNWKNAVLANDLDKKTSYMLVDSDASSIIKTYSIDFLPRYIIIDKKGRILTDDAPRPSDVKLKELIDKNLLQFY